eukprot:TRINITY_DN127_c0_g1_i10.p1 TRINITY_DN127_c0_g1~~TRINITY_DN127_c0_g1_i10.p1  ORF type:complete len:208 (-),score=28.10 TRINITY_DN127_c0_g1_i10:57-680(-)
MVAVWSTTGVTLSRLLAAFELLSTIPYGRFLFRFFALAGLITRGASGDALSKLAEGPVVSNNEEICFHSSHCKMENSSLFETTGPSASLLRASPEAPIVISPASAKNLKRTLPHGMVDNNSKAANKRLRVTPVVDHTATISSRIDSLEQQVQQQDQQRQQLQQQVQQQLQQLQQQVQQQDQQLQQQVQQQNQQLQQQIQDVLAVVQR